MAVSVDGTRDPAGLPMPPRGDTLESRLIACAGQYVPRSYAVRTRLCLIARSLGSLAPPS